MDNRRNEPNLKLINMEQVEIEKIGWLLYPFIPFGKVTIVQGDPGEGKTTMVLQIIAKLTKGEAVLPSGSDEPALEEKTMDLEPVNVIYQTAEDGLGDTITCCVSCEKLPCTGRKIHCISFRQRYWI